jgi:hypothetical protein
LIALWLLLLMAPFAWGVGGDPPRAVIAGTVFRDPGFALPRVEVILTAKVAPAGAKKAKPQKLLTDARGEFAFYVPPEKATYVVSVKAAGLEPQEKTVELSGGFERTDTYFTLKPASGAPAKE